jgi:hypothetical protein
MGMKVDVVLLDREKGVRCAGSENPFSRPPRSASAQQWHGSDGLDGLWAMWAAREKSGRWAGKAAELVEGMGPRRI